jgi:hypothetical protein
VFDPHELVHAYVTPRWGESVPLLREGIAVALSCRPFRSPNRKLSWREVFAGTQRVDSQAFLLAGAFVTSLLQRPDGLNQFRLFYDLVGRGATEEELAVVYEQLYGETLDDAWAALLARPQLAPCIPHWACAAPELTGEADVGPSCSGSDESVFVPSAQAGTVIEITGSRLRAVACDGSMRQLLLDGPERQAGISRTSYWFPSLNIPFALTRFGEGDDITSDPEPTHVEISYPARPWASRDCGELDALTVGPGAAIGVVTNEEHSFVRLASADGSPLTVQLAGNWQTCSDCTATTCDDAFGFASVDVAARPFVNIEQPFGLDILRIEVER